MEVDDTVAASFDFETSPALGVLHVNQFQPVNENLLEFAGTEGCLRIREPSFQCEVFSKGASAWDAVHIYGGDYLDACGVRALPDRNRGGANENLIADAASTLRGAWTCWKLSRTIAGAPRLSACIRPVTVSSLMLCRRACEGA